MTGTRVDVDALTRARAFAPMRLVEHVAASGEFVTVAGCALFADLSDFTGLTEELTVKAGTDGAALVGHDLNRALGPVVSAVIDNGGEVVKFSGDGLLCVFLGGRESASAAARAAQAIVESRIESPSGKTHRFRVAVVQGDIALARIGGHRGRFEIVAGGAAVEDAQRRAVAAMPGTFVPSPFHTVASPSDPGHPAAAFDPGAHVPGFVLARLDGGMPDWMQELRNLTMLFASVGVDRDGQLLQQAALSCQAAIDGQGGEILRLGLEGSNLVVEAVFGLAFRTEATGPREALQCAADLVEKVEGARVGVATGRVLLGPIGSPSRRQMTSLGTTVNLAARLMQVASAGEVLADDATWRLAKTFMPAERRHAHLKGIGDRPFWHMDRSRHGGVAAKHVSGRAPEMAAAVAALASSRVPAQTIVIEGEAGIGKTHFRLWLAGQLGRLGVAVWSASATPVGRDTPYAGLLPLVSALCGLQAGMDPALRLSKVAVNVLGDAGRAPLFGDALGLSLPDTDETRALMGTVRADNIRDALCSLVRRAHRDGAGAIVVEDAHWLDSASWALLQRLSYEPDSPRIVLVTRPMRARQPSELTVIKSRDALVLELGPLEAADISDIAAERFGTPDVPVEVSRWIGERAQGNPFFAQELAATLMDVGHVKVEGRSFVRLPTPSELQAMPLAATIESTLEQRIDRLSLEDAVALKVASVIGPTFSIELLEQLGVPSSAGHLRSSLGRLADEDMVVVVEGAGDRFAFRHRYTQEAAYRTLPVEQRQDLHRRIADWIESRPEHRPEERAGELAHHWFQSRDPTRAIRWLELAGGRALRTGADREAATHFGRALAIGAGLPAARRAAWQRQLAQALLGLGEVEQVADQARRAVELVAPLLPRTPRAWLWFSARIVVLRIVRIRGRRAVRADEVEAWLEGARAAGLLAESAYFLNAPEMMLGSALLAVEMADRTADATPVSVAYGMLGMVAGMARLRGIAMRHLRRARTLSEAAKDPHQQGVAWFYTAMYFACVGEWKSSLDAAQRALAITEGLRANTQSGFQLTLIATNALYTGEYADTCRWMALVRVRAERASNVQQLGWSSNVVAVYHLHQARYDAAIELAEHARQLFLRERDLISLIISEGIQCAAHARAGRLGEALLTASRASALIANARPTTWGQLEGFAGPCEAYALALAQGLATRRDARVALAGLRRFSIVFTFGRARLHWIEGMFAQGVGALRPARRRYRLAIVAARECGMPFEEYRASELLAPLVEGIEHERLTTSITGLRQRILTPA